MNRILTGLSNLLPSIGVMMGGSVVFFLGVLVFEGGRKAEQVINASQASKHQENQRDLNRGKNTDRSNQSGVVVFLDVGGDGHCETGKDADRCVACEKAVEPSTAKIIIVHRISSLANVKAEPRAPRVGSGDQLKSDLKK